MRFVSPALKHVVYPTLAGAGWFRRSAVRGFSVVTYHGVQPTGYTPIDSGLDGNLVSAETLRRQLRLLKTNYEVIAPDDFRTSLLNGNQLPARSVLITCDDGLLNNLTDMLPVLQSESVKCLFFVTGASAGETPAILWYEQLLLAMLRAPAGKFRVSIPDFSVEDELAGVNQRRALWWALVRRLSSLDATARADFSLAAAHEWPDSTVSRDEATQRRFHLLTRAQLQELQAAGMTIGAHSMTHPMLSKQSPEFAREEIVNSRSALEEAVARPVWALAYPFGDPSSVNAQTMSLAREAGFEAAFLNHGGGFAAATDHFAIPRTHVSAEMGLAELEAHVSGFHNSLQRRIRRSTAENEAKIKITVLREVPEVASLREQWNALVARMRRPEVFYTYEWARAVAATLGDSLRPLLLLGHDDAGKLVGIAALAIGDSGQIGFLCATTADYCDFVVREGMERMFAREVCQTLQREGFAETVLTNFPADSPSFAALQRAARAGGYHLFARTAYHCAQVELANLSLTPQGKIYLPRQKMVRRFLKAMDEGGKVAVLHQQNWDEVGPSLPDFYRAHVARFLYTGRISNLARPERRRFLRELARQLADAGWLRVSQIRSGARSISWNYGFKFDKTWFWYQPTFVNDLEKLSPGFVLLSKLIEQAVNEPNCETVDMGLGAEGYKERFSNASRRTMYVMLHRSRGSHWREMVRYSLASTLTAIPAVERRARGLLAQANAVRERMRRAGLKSTGAWALMRGRRLFNWSEEVFFFAGDSSVRASSQEFQLRPITWDVLAEAAMQYFDDDRTLACLLRGAARLRANSAQGFVLVNQHEQILHLAWVSPFGGFFLDELKHKLECSDVERTMIFDCWTPVAQRGRGYYAEALRRIVLQQLAMGKRPWIFSAASNQPSRRGIENAGFELRYSLISRNTLGWHRVSQHYIAPAPSPASEAAA